MIAYLSNRTVDFFVCKNIIDIEDYEIYAYGIELLIADFVNFCMVLMIGFLLHSLETGIVFLLCFVPTRQFSGGYHASTHAKCRCAMIFTFLSLLFGVNLLPPQEYSYILLMNLASLIVFWNLAPIENSKKQLSKECKKKNRTYAIVSAIVLVLISSILCILGRTEGVVITLTLFIISGLMIIENERQRRQRNVE